MEVALCSNSCSGLKLGQFGAVVVMMVVLMVLIEMWVPRLETDWLADERLRDSA